MSSSSAPDRGAAAVRAGRARPLALLVAGLITGLLAALAPVGAAPALGATGGCRAVSGAPASSAGPNRATIVVDTGSGPVWSACVSFSGEITGIEAIELARAQIPGLAPVYDIYAGEGRAVCRLRGVGNDPPDCLGKTVDYWGYFRNGRYWSTGAGAVRVHDGDVEAWRWGSSGATPRRATQGYEAAPYVAPATTAPPTTRPPAPPTTSAVIPPSGGGSPTTAAPGVTTAPTGDPAASSTTTSTAAAAGATTSTSIAAGPGSSTTSPSSTVASSSAAEPASSSGEGELAAGTPGGPSLDQGDGGSGAGSIAAFAAALAVVAGGAVLVRRRRNAVA